MKNTVELNRESFSDFISKNRHELLTSGRTVTQETQDLLAKACNYCMRNEYYDPDNGNGSSADRPSREKKLKEKILNKIVWYDEQAEKQFDMTVLKGKRQDIEKMSEKEQAELIRQFASFPSTR